MAKETIAPDRKAVPSSGGVKEPNHSTISTPKQLEAGKVPWGKESKDKLI